MTTAPTALASASRGTPAEDPALPHFHPVPRPVAVLVVDDEPIIRRPIAMFLQGRGYAVEVAGSAVEALAALRARAFDGMLADVRMPESSGLELLPRALAIDPDLAVVMLTAVDDATTATAALQLGAREYVVKTAALDELEIALVRALRDRETAMRRAREARARHAELSLATSELALERQRAREATIGTVEALIVAMEAKDVYLRGHSTRVAALAAAIAETMGLPPDVVEDVRIAGRLHDVGLIGIREAVLHKVEPLTTEELAHIREHVRIGLDILRPVRHLGHVIAYIADHHERWDGTGYPQGNAGTAISIGGRILAAADAFDALVSRRAYRAEVAPAQALETLGYVVGGLLDPEVYGALVGVIRRGTLLPLLPTTGVR